MNFDNGAKQVTEYEAFEAALRMAERETTATMLRVAKTYEVEAHKQSHSDNNPSPPPK
jgi:hypothetical protein